MSSATAPLKESEKKLQPGPARLPLHLFGSLPRQIHTVHSKKMELNTVCIACLLSFTFSLFFSVYTRSNLQHILSHDHCTKNKVQQGYLQPTLGCLNLQMPWWTLVDIKCGNEFLRTFAGHVCMSHCLILKHIAAFNKNSLHTI